MLNFIPPPRELQTREKEKPKMKCNKDSWIAIQKKKNKQKEGGKRNKKRERTETMRSFFLKEQSQND